MMSRAVASRICYLIAWVSTVASLSKNNYGPYVAHWNSFEKCKGPKQRDLATYEAKIYKENNTYRFELNATFLIEFKFEYLKIVVTPLSGSNKASQWKYKIDNPCKHPVVALCLMGLADLRTCHILKGTQHVALNFTDLATKFLGTDFFYGDFLFKIMAIAAKGNLACFQYITKFEKKILD